VATTVYVYVPFDNVAGERRIMKSAIDACARTEKGFGTFMDV